MIPDDRPQNEQQAMRAQSAQFTAFDREKISEASRQLAEIGRMFMQDGKTATDRHYELVKRFELAQQALDFKDKAREKFETDLLRRLDKQDEGIKDHEKRIDGIEKREERASGKIAGIAITVGVISGVLTPIILAFVNNWISSAVAHGAK